jgi:hypothetical protein
LTQAQIQRLHEEKPAISIDQPTAENAMNASKGSQWLVCLTTSGELQVCHLAFSLAVAC